MTKKLTVGKEEYDEAFLTTLLQSAGLDLQDYSPARVVGPFDGKINSMYRLDFPADPPLLLRFRVSEAFRYEPIVKEKILYPFLDGTLDPHAPDAGARVQAMVAQKRGSYVFPPDRPPLVPVQDVLHWDETRERVPYDFTIKEFVPGISLYDLLASGRVEATATPVVALFEELGRVLGELHQVTFDGFYERITDIGQPDKQVTWPELFDRMLAKEMGEARGNASIQSYLPALEQYFADHADLIVADETPVIFHNDFQAQNFILRPPPPAGAPIETLELAALIDFDNWRVGTRAQDFVKILYWTIKDAAVLKSAFFRGYEHYHPVDAQFRQQIEILQLLWFILVYNFEEDKIRKAEQNATVDARFPASAVYLEEIKKIVHEK